MEGLTPDVFKRIMQEFECPVCLDHMLPPIIMICNNGHNVCNKCAPNLQDGCPTCRQPAVNIRNIAMENVARNVTYPCINQKWGCDKAFPITEITNHQAECFHSRRKCPWAAPCGKCTWTGNTADLNQHLDDCHANITHFVDIRQKVTVSVSTYGKKTLFPDKIINTLGNNFIHCSSFMNNKFYCIVQYVGLKQDADKYKYTFSVSRDGGAKKISVTHRVCSDTVELIKIREEGECVNLPCDLLTEYCSDGDSEEDGYSLFPVLKYSIKISEI